MSGVSRPVGDVSYGGLLVMEVRFRFVPMKVSEILRLLEQDGWTLKRVTGSHRHYTHPGKPGLVTVAGKPSATLKPKTEASILKQAGLRREGS